MIDGQVEPLFRIKVCGVTTPDDARAAADAGVDCIGLNFYPGSKRFITPAVAEAIVAALPAGFVKVGLFVDAPPAEVSALVNRLGLDLAQLHGRESPDSLAALMGIGIIKAFASSTPLQELRDYLDACAALGAMPWLTLLDAPAPVNGPAGGTGQLADQSLARLYREAANVPPLVLAGGLTPTNVAEAIRRVHPASVDVASGVESAPGKKDARLMASFVRAARAAFEQG
jgi:phosphoribosylanthranilate isomerase